jgi:hypothetical protein
VVGKKLKLAGKGLQRKVVVYEFIKDRNFAGLA